MRNRESEEMYLETILRLKERKSSLRSVDIVEELGYAKSSVSRAINLLKAKRYIIIADGGEIIFTESGKSKATEIFNRHNIITRALIKMGAEPKTAEDNACRIEHIITSDLLEIIKDFADKP